MHSLKPAVLLTLLALLLAACGGATSDQIAACRPLGDAAVDVTGIPAGSFRATVSGVREGEFSGQAAYIRTESGDGFLLNLSGQDGVAGATVAIIMPSAIAPGVCTPKSYFSALDLENKVIDLGMSFSAISDSGNGVFVFSTVTQGELVLSALNPMTGRFSFTANADDGQTVTVSGTLNQIGLVD